jgi:two-component system phosphate regulon sensor histidine kinase PhoR
MNRSCHIERDRSPWCMTATPRVQKNSDFESLLLAVAGHDLRQPLQILQSAHELLGLGVRTNSELRLLRSGQSAIDRLKEPLDLPPKKWTGLSCF